MKSIFEQMGGTYHWEGDYLIPDLTLGEDANRDIGTYGRKRMRFLEESHKKFFSHARLRKWEIQVIIGEKGNAAGSRRPSPTR